MNLEEIKLKELVNVKGLATVTGIPYQKLDNNLKGKSKSLNGEDALKLFTALTRAAQLSLKLSEK